MVSTRQNTRSRQVFQEDVSSGRDSEEDYDSGEGSSEILQEDISSGDSDEDHDSEDSSQIFQEDFYSWDSGEDYDSGEGSCSVTTGRHGSRASRTTALKRKGKQSEKRHDTGEFSKLLAMPLDVLYEVSWIDCSPKVEGITRR